MKNFLLAFLFLSITTAGFAATIGNKVQNNSLIIYNGNIALVHEKRDLYIDKTDKKIIYTDVANTIDTDSVNIKLPDSITLYMQQYRFDKLTRQKLLNAHIGKEVTIKILKDTKKFQKIKATLLSTNGSYSIVKTTDGEILSVLSNDIIFKNIPDKLITKPSLVWRVSVKKTLHSKIEIDYIIKNINWKSDYILDLTKNKANLSGWISIANRSGKRFDNTKLYVLAGDINKATKPRNMYRTVKCMTFDSKAQKVSQQAHEGYHFYTIPFRVDIANNETTQIKFIDKKNINIDRRYSVTLTNPNYFNTERQHNVTQYIHIKKLNFPLPKGIIRTYSELKNTTILLGETTIKHTPKKTPIDLKLGKNFDIKVTETILSRDDTKQYRDATISYTIKNTSNTTKNVKILIPFNKNKTSIIETLKPYKFTKGNFVTFNIKVKPNSSKRFQVHFRDFINF